MISVEAMADELIKIAAVKCRTRAVPIRVSNLAKKETMDRRLYKKADVKTEAAKGLLRRHGGKGLMIGGGIAAWEAGKQAKDDYKMGRQYRRQMEKSKR